MNIISEAYKKRLMSLSGIKSTLDESARIDFLKKDFTERVDRKYEKFLKFFNKGIWDKEKEPDNFIKNVVSETIFKNGKLIPKDVWVKLMLKQFNKLEKSDPTENKQYLNWIINIYLSGNLLDEDIYKIPDTLKLFSKNKDKLPLENRNINSFTDLTSLYDAVSKFDNGGDMSASEKEKLVKLEGAEQVYDSPDWKIIIPKTPAAACLYGRNTRWCTASQNDNRFNYYSKQGDLYILIDKRIKDDRNKMKKLQFHFETNQFMDATDAQIKKTAFFKSNPEILKFFEKLKKIDASFKIDNMLVTKQEGLELLKDNTEKILLIKNKGYSFMEKFYLEMGAKNEFINLILNDFEFIKQIFELNKFDDLISSYKNFNLSDEGLKILKSLPWLNDWLKTREDPKTIEHFIISLVKLGDEAKKWAGELLKKDGVIWNVLIASKHFSHYFNTISNTQVFGTKGLQIVKKMLTNPDIVDELKMKGMSKTTLQMLNQFYTNIRENKEAVMYYKNILNLKG